MKRIQLFEVSILTLTLAALSGCASVKKEVAADDAIQNITTIAESFGDGEKVSAVVLEYPQTINQASLSINTYTVQNRKIDSVYTNSRPEKTDKPVSGKYVIINLTYENKWDLINPENPGVMPADMKPKHDEASDPEKNGPNYDDDGTPVDLTATVTQIQSLSAKSGTIYTPSAQSMKSTAATELIIQDFKKYEYSDAETGAIIPYFVYLPKNYTTTKKYPLVFFIPDASADTNIDSATLTQGNGATIWASESEQAKHPAIVVAVQYPKSLVTSIGPLTADSNTWTTGLTLVDNLLHSVIATYSVDQNKIYGTGQSQGCMSNIALSDKHPDLFTAQLLVAGQWNVQEMAALKNKKLWIVVCQGDTKAYPGMNAATTLWESLGTKVARNTEMWNPKASVEETAKNIADMEAQGARINYSVIAGGSHMYTWNLAYNMEGLRDWLFKQTKTDK